MNPFLHDASEEIKKSLFHNAMKSNWHEVIKTYQQNQAAHKTKITRSGDTALHIAVSNGEESVVKDLVAAAADTLGALGTKNKLGNTPLHLAAYLGNARMCHCIARRDNTLMGIRNGDSETPFFLAVRHGRKEAFHALHSVLGPGEGYKYCRGKGGETILHSAISGEYFDLAFCIAKLYDRIPYAVNERGLSALHILATKSDSFKSGTRIRGLYKLIYKCIIVDKLPQESIDSILSGDHEREKGVKYSLRNAMRVLFGRSSKQRDEENIMRRQEEAKFLRNILKLISNVTLLFLGFITLGLSTERIREEKAKHIWSVQIMDILLEQIYSSHSQYEYEMSSQYEYEISPLFILPDQDGETHDDYRHESIEENKNESVVMMEKQNNKEKRALLEMERGATPILIAANNGVTEIVEGILQRCPKAIHDKTHDEKNAVLLAVESRQSAMYRLLLQKKNINIFLKIDNDGNNALHLAARRHNIPPGSAGIILQMQWETKWYEFVKNTMPRHFFPIPTYNNECKTAREIFSETHRDLVAEDSKWLIKTSESCSVVAALVATVAFAASATIPGGESDSGTPALQNDPAFSIFAIASLVALILSITSVLMFLAILTSRHSEQDFLKNLPRKLVVELTSLLISIAAILISFCGGHFLALEAKYKFATVPMYVILCFPLAFFAVAAFPQYSNLFVATISSVPQRIYN